MSVLNSEAVISSLLSAAQLTVSDAEEATFVKDYPLIRAAADALYLPDLEFVEPTPGFRPLDFYTAD